METFAVLLCYFLFMQEKLYTFLKVSQKMFVMFILSQSAAIRYSRICLKHTERETYFSSAGLQSAGATLWLLDALIIYCLHTREFVQGQLLSLHLSTVTLSMTYQVQFYIWKKNSVFITYALFTQNVKLFVFLHAENFKTFVVDITIN